MKKLAKNKMVYVDSFSYHTTLGISIIINTILVVSLYKLGIFGIVWPGFNLGNTIPGYTSDFFIYP